MHLTGVQVVLGLDMYCSIPPCPLKKVCVWLCVSRVKVELYSNLSAPDI